MRALGPDFDAQLNRLNAYYENIYKPTAKPQQQWNALHPLEFGYRSQQLKCLAEMLYAQGFVSLEGMRILDVGCGTGRLLGSLGAVGARPDMLEGIDLNSDAIKFAKERYPGISFQCVQGGHIPFPDNYFDLVIQSVVFSSIALPGLRQHLASEMLRVTRGGGFVYWWDMPCTLREYGSESIAPMILFPGLVCTRRNVAWLPKPSEGIAKRRWRYSVGWVMDLVAARPTHVAALLGPKIAGDFGEADSKPQKQTR